MTTFGWTWEYVDDHMTLPRLEAVWRQWKRFPPIHMMVGSYFGYGKAKDEASFDDANAMMRALIAEMPT